MGKCGGVGRPTNATGTSSSLSAPFWQFADSSHTKLHIGFHPTLMCPPLLIPPEAQPPASARSSAP